MIELSGCEFRLQSDSHPRVLERAGYRVVEAAGAREVVEQLALNEPVLIILDCMLGGPGYGLDLLRELRATPRTQHIPVVIASGLPDP